MAHKSKDAHLYGLPRSSTRAAPGGKAISANSLAFDSALSSLIAGGASKPDETGAKRPNLKAKKDDIFSTHNRNAKKRAAADMSASSQDKSAERLDETAWRSARRKMENKARLYAALKRGDVEDLDGRHNVDFDRKWAENGGDEEEEVVSSSESDAESLVEFVDEFGRTRTGPRSQALRLEAARATGRRIEAQADWTNARPSAPSNIIYGDTIQAAAFERDMDEERRAAIEALAARRDREATPPEAVHYDAKKEVRDRGTGFFTFSSDAAERQKQMDSLERERLETERARTALEERRANRAAALEARREAIRQAKARTEANNFLAALETDMLGGGHSDKPDMDAASPQGAAPPSEHATQERLRDEHNSQDQNKDEASREAEASPLPG